MIALAIFIVSVVQSSAFVCPKSCKELQCPEETKRCDNDGMVLMQNAGTCGCCPKCVRVLGKGESCDTLFWDQPSGIECETGLFCNGKVCVKDNCANKRDMIKSSRGASSLKCLANGDYASVQCEPHGSCSCMTANGDKIPDIAVPSRYSSKMNCKCALDRFEYEKKKILGKIYSCDELGNYEKVQCTGSVCHCVNEDGLELQSGPKVGIWEIKNLKC